MNIGMTYDLRDDYIALGMKEEETAEFDSMVTVDAIERTLQDLGYRTERVGHIRHLVSRLAAGSRWDMVFNIAEGVRGFGREAQVPALLDAYGIPYTFSDPLVLALTLHKGMTKRIIRDLGIPTPDFSVVETESDMERIDLPFPLFAKPIAEGTGKGINALSKIKGSMDLSRVCRDLLLRFKQPVLVERFLPGREFTVGIVGTGKNASVVGVMEVVLLESAEPEVYSYWNKEKCESLVKYRLADDEEARKASQVALAAWRGLGCRDGGRLDLRSDETGLPHFMEVNPLAGLHPEHSDLPILNGLAGRTYRDLLARIMESALQRASAED
jgi:D-alanine-D-alanine ligase